MGAKEGNFLVQISAGCKYTDSTTLRFQHISELKLAISELIDIVIGYGADGTKVTIQKLHMDVPQTADTAEGDTEDAGDDG